MTQKRMVKNILLLINLKMLTLIKKNMSLRHILQKEWIIQDSFVCSLPKQAYVKKEQLMIKNMNCRFSTKNVGGHHYQTPYKAMPKPDRNGLDEAAQ